jgi:hypothetical protein
MHLVVKHGFNAFVQMLGQIFGQFRFRHPNKVCEFSIQLGVPFNKVAPQEKSLSRVREVTESRSIPFPFDLHFLVSRLQLRNVRGARFP